MAAFDLDAYFQRTGDTGGRSPTLATLSAIHLCHAEAIPFENLSPFLGWPVPLDAQSLQQKMARAAAAATVLSKTFSSTTP